MQTTDFPLVVLAPQAIQETKTETKTGIGTERAIEQRRNEIVAANEQRQREQQRKEAEARERVAFALD